MGIVRREDNWRLDKQADGVYEVTYEGQPELKLITPDYEPTGFMDERGDFTLPVREVESFSEAEQVFEEIAQGDPSMTGFGTTASRVNSSGFDGAIDRLGDDSELPDLPPAGFFFVGVIAGGYALTQARLDFQSPVFLIGIALLLLPVVIVGTAYRVYQSEGAGATFEYLISVESDEEGVTRNNDMGEVATKEDAIETTPPAPQQIKDEIYFDRAKQNCEWCDERTDSPEVHHIEPRSEGGRNDYRNLIALCPHCHRMADKGGISRTKLRSKVSRQMDGWSSESTGKTHLHR